MVPVPEPREEKACAVCGEVHPDGQHPLAQLLGAAESVRVVKAIVLEVGDAPENLVPFEAGATVFFTEGKGIVIGDVRFMLAQNVIAWE